MSSPDHGSSTSTALFFGVFDSKQELVERSTIAARITPVLKKFVLSKDQILAILEGIRSVAEISDLTLLIVVGWMLVPLLETWYEQTPLGIPLVGNPFSSSSFSTTSSEELTSRPALQSSQLQIGGNLESTSQSDPLVPSQQPATPTAMSSFSSLSLSSPSPQQIQHQNHDHRRRRPFRSTKIFHIGNTLSEMAKLGLAVYGVDMMKIVLLGAGFDIPKSTRVTHAFAYVAYTLWFFSRISTFKRYIIHKLYKRRQQHDVNDDKLTDDRGRLQIIDRLTDAGLIILTAFTLLEILNIEMGVAVRGFVAVGSVWTLVVSLAMKEIVSNFFNGILLSASDRIYEGDTVQISKSGFKGAVERLGWLETVLRGHDDIMLTVPNTELQGSQVSNLSRIHVCQVYQTLRFKYSDATKLPNLLHDIKCEIRSSCPTVITDGSRPFRCYWTNFQSSYLEVVVDAHFRIRPVGDAYYENRQRVLFAIDRAVKMNDVSYA